MRGCAHAVHIAHRRTGDWRYAAFAAATAGHLGGGLGVQLQIEQAGGARSTIAWDRRDHKNLPAAGIRPKRSRSGELKAPAWWWLPPGERPPQGTERCGRAAAGQR